MWDGIPARLAKEDKKFIYHLLCECGRVKNFGLAVRRLVDCGLSHKVGCMTKNGDGIKTVQGNMGHATAAFTLDVYGHVSERMKEDSAARMEAYIQAL